MCVCVCKYEKNMKKNMLNAYYLTIILYIYMYITYFILYTYYIYITYYISRIIS